MNDPQDFSEAEHAYWEGRAEQKEICSARIAELESRLAAYNKEKSDKLKLPLNQRIFNNLKDQASAPHEYINPHFLKEIADALEKYYKTEDSNVDTWIKDMFDA